MKKSLLLCLLCLMQLPMLFAQRAVAEIDGTRFEFDKHDAVLDGRGGIYLKFSYQNHQLIFFLKHKFGDGLGENLHAEVEGDMPARAMAFYYQPLSNVLADKLYYAYSSGNIDISHGSDGTVSGMFSFTAYPGIGTSDEDHIVEISNGFFLDIPLSGPFVPGSDECIVTEASSYVEWGRREMTYYNYDKEGKLVWHEEKFFDEVGEYWADHFIFYNGKTARSVWSKTIYYDPFNGDTRAPVSYFSYGEKRFISFGGRTSRINYYRYSQFRDPSKNSRAWALVSAEDFFYNIEGRVVQKNKTDAEGSATVFNYQYSSEGNVVKTVESKNAGETQLGETTLGNYSAFPNWYDMLTERTGLNFFYGLDDLEIEGSAFSINNLGAYRGKSRTDFIEGTSSESGVVDFQDSTYPYYYHIIGTILSDYKDPSEKGEFRAVNDLWTFRYRCGIEGSLPSVPGKVTISNIHSNGFTATWPASAETDLYEVDVSADDFQTFVAGYGSRSTTGLSIDLVGLVPATSYKFRVRAINQTGASDNSVSVAVTTNQAEPTVAPSALEAVSISSTGFKAQWTEIPGVQEYRIDVSADNFATYATGYENVKVEGATSLLITGLSSATSYQYRVRAVNSRGASENSDVISVTTNTENGLPAPVGIIASFISNTGFFVQWDPVPGIYEYRIDVSTDNFSSFVLRDFLRQLDYIPQGKVGVNFVALLPNTAYQVRIRAVDGNGPSGNSAPLQVATKQNLPVISANQWIRHIGDTGDDVITSITADSEGNIYATGFFSGMVVFETYTLTSTGRNDIFLVKFNKAGTVQWAESIGGTENDEGWQIFADASGVYLAGVFAGTVDFDPDADINAVTARGAGSHPTLPLDDGFLARFDLTDGSLVWAQSLGDAWPIYYGGKGIVSDGEVVYLTGVFSGTNDFDAGTGTMELSSYFGSPDAFMLRVNAIDGTLSWAQAIGGDGPDNGTSLLLDGPDLYATGFYKGNTDLDPGAGQENVTGNGAYFTKFIASTGAFVWAKNISSTNFAEIYDIVRIDNSVYVSGTFNGSTNFDVGSPANEENGYSGFLVRYNLSDGAFRDVRVMSGTDGVYPLRLAAHSGKLYVAGNSNWSADFDTGLGESNHSSFGYDIFIAEYDMNGGFRWSKKIGGDGSEDLRGSLAVTADGLFTGGGFQSTVDFNPYGEILEETSAGGLDAFIARYELVPTLPIKAPEASVATYVSTGRFTANWHSVTGAIEYSLDVSTDNFRTFVPGFYKKAVNTTSAAVAELATNTSYQYRVRAVDLNGASIHSNVIMVKTLSASQTQAPTTLTARGVLRNSFTATWSEVAGATEYRLDLSVDNFVTFLPGYYNRTVAGTSHLITELIENNNYQYRVRAVSSLGTSANSNVMTVTTPGLSPPVATSAHSISQTGFTAFWEPVDGVMIYKLEVSTDNFNTFISDYEDRETLEEKSDVTGLAANSGYQYRVRAVGVNSTSVPSNIIQVKTLSPGVTPKPYATSATNISETSFVSNWNAVSGAEYRLDVSMDNFSTFVAGYWDKPVTATNQTVTGLGINTQYQYRVRAVDVNGTSEHSNVIEVTTLAESSILAPLATLATDVRNDGFVANWSAVEGAMSYRLDVSFDEFATFVTGYDNKAVTGTSHEVMGLTPGITYHYRLRAINAIGLSQNSNPISVTTLPDPNTPVALAATLVTATTFTANWSEVPSATGYRLDVSADDFGSFVDGYHNKFVTGTSDVVTNLGSSTSYQYRVRAEIGHDMSPYSNVVNVFTANMQDQNIYFADIASKTLNDPPFVLDATASSGLEISFSTTSGKIRISGDTVTLLSAGSATITASQDGDRNFNAAPSVDQTFCIDPPRPSITLSTADTGAPVLTSSAESGNQWFFNGIEMSGDSTTSINVAAAGLYSVLVMTDNCASDFSEEFSIVITDIEPSVSQEVKLYPNPVQDKMYVVLPHQGLKRLKIVQPDGRIIYRYDTPEMSAEIYTTDWAPGIYQLQVFFDQSLATRKFIRK